LETATARTDHSHAPPSATSTGLLVGLLKMGDNASIELFDRGSVRRGGRGFERATTVATVSRRPSWWHKTEFFGKLGETAVVVAAS